MQHEGSDALAGVRAFGRMYELQQLSLAHCNPCVTDDFLHQLRAYELRWMSVAGCTASTRGIATLIQHSKLIQVRLRRPVIVSQPQT